jgi:hypothetical protein
MACKAIGKSVRTEVALLFGLSPVMLNTGVSAYSCAMTGKFVECEWLRR